MLCIIINAGRTYKRWICIHRLVWFKKRPERNEIDLGYRFMQKAWGKGYATEAAYASIKYGFKNLNLTRIVGKAMPDNTNSIRVL